MSKKSLNQKEVLKTINAELETGKSKREILDDLSEIYYDKKSIATMLASTPNKEIKKKFKTLNNVLFGLLIGAILIKTGIGILLFSRLSAYLVPIAFILPILTIFFALEVSKYKGYIYNILGLLAIGSVLKSAGDIFETGVWGMFDVSLGILVAGLSFYLAKKMFPHYGLFGLKKMDKEVIFWNK